MILFWDQGKKITFWVKSRDKSQEISPTTNVNGHRKIQNHAKKPQVTQNK